MESSKLMNIATPSGSSLAVPSKIGGVGARRLRLILKRIDDNKKSASSPVGNGEQKRKREDDNDNEVEDTGTVIETSRRDKESLENLQRRLCPDKLEITLKRLRFKEILVTTPSKGEREVHYFGLASDSEEEEEDDDTDKNNDDQKRRGKMKYEDWRLQTIKAFPPSSLGKLKSSHEIVDKENRPPTSYFMEIPSLYDFVFNVGYAKDDLHSVLEILDGGKMSMNIIDGYLMLRLEKYYKDFYSQVDRQLANKARASSSTEYSFRSSGKPKTVQNAVITTTPTNFQYLSVCFMPVEDRDQPVSTFIPNMKCLPNLSNLGDDSDVQLIAPLYASHHLYLAVFNFQEKRVYVYDSSWHYLPQPLREGQIQAILQAISPSEPQNQNEDNLLSLKWQINFMETSCPQYDEYSCGIFTIHYAENVLRGVAHHKNRWQLSKIRVTQIRRHIAKELLSTTLAGRRFLQAISD